MNVATRELSQDVQANRAHFGVNDRVDVAHMNKDGEAETPPAAAESFAGVDRAALSVSSGDSPPATIDARRSAKLCVRGGDMSEANKQLARRWFDEVWNKQRRQAIAEMLDSDSVVHEGAHSARGPEGFYSFYDRMQAAFSNSVVCRLYTKVFQNRGCRLRAAMTPWSRIDTAFNPSECVENLKSLVVSPFTSSRSCQNSMSVIASQQSFAASTCSLKQRDGKRGLFTRLAK
jgi:SnoaL-like polyketide cyclase